MEGFGKICHWALGADRQPIAGRGLVPNSCYSGQPSSPKSNHCPTHPWSETTRLQKIRYKPVSDNWELMILCSDPVSSLLEMIDNPSGAKCLARCTSSNHFEI